MSKQSRVLFVHIDPSGVSFIKKDIEVLSRHFDLREIYYRNRSDIPRIVTGTLWADLTYCWFTWDHAAWTIRCSRLFGKKSITVVGGFDVVKMPEISYGNLRHPRSAARTRYTILHADKVIASSHSLKDNAECFTGRKDIEVVYHGFDSQLFKPLNQKENIALSVGAVNRSNMKRKGLETFIKAAAYAPEISFRLVGKIETGMHDVIKNIAPANLELLGEVDFETLVREMQRAAVYVQVSAHEGFGCSLAEAMLCSAIPVVTKVGAIPEVVGDSGIYVPQESPKATAEAIRLAIKNKDGMTARKRIVDLFPLEKRNARLVSIVERLIKSKEGDKR